MKAKNIAFKFNFTKEVPFQVISDERRLKQVLINLISNALKFTNRGSIVVNCDFNKKYKLLNFQVEDTGCGIKRAD